MRPCDGAAFDARAADAQDARVIRIAPLLAGLALAGLLIADAAPALAKDMPVAIRRAQPGKKEGDAPKAPAQPPLTVQGPKAQTPPATPPKPAN